MTSTISFESVLERTRDLYREGGRALLLPCFAVWAFSEIGGLVPRLMSQLHHGPADAASGAEIVVYFALFVAALLLQYGLAICGLRAALGLEVGAGTLLTAFRDSFRGVFALLGMGLLVIGFSLFFVVPGLMAYVMLYPAVFVLAANRESGVFDAFGRSMALTNGSRWTLFRLLLLFEGPVFVLNLGFSAVQEWALVPERFVPLLLLGEAVASLVVSLTLIPRLQLSTALYFLEAAGPDAMKEGTPVWTVESEAGE